MPDQIIGPGQVAMLLRGNEGYGIATVVRLYATNWPELTFVSMARGKMYDWLREHGHHVELVEGLSEYSSSGSFQMLARLPSAIRQAKIDARRVDERLSGRGIRVVHAHSRPQQYTAGFMRRSGYFAVWHIHANTSQTRLLGLGLKLNHLSARWGADLIVPVSDATGASWRGSGVRCHTVRNCAVSLFDRPSEPPTNGPLRCLVAGRMEESKGQHVAVEGVIRARRAGCDVTLDVFGGPVEDNPYVTDLQATIRAAGEESAIRIMGYCDDLRQRHRDYHLGLQCRIDPEPCSMWVCESMVDGLPLLASATGGTPELVDDGVTGYLYPSGSAEELSRRLIELWNDRPRLAKMRLAAFARGQEQFTVPRFLNDTLAAYNSLI